MFSLLSKLQEKAKMWKRLFHATDFESLMYPSFTFCYILGIFPYKIINASAFEISKPRYIFSTVVMCVCFIGLLSSLYMMDICEIPKSTGVPRTLERNCYYILSGFVAVVTYILSGPRMRLLQSIMEISWKLPPESYQKLSRLIHAKDILGSLFLVLISSIYLKTNIHIILKIFLVYVILIVFHMDMLYMNCVCVLKACFKQINDNLEHIRYHMMNDEVHHLDRMHYRQRSSVLLIKLKALEKQHQMISDAVQRMNMIFSLQLLATIILTFIEITFQLYFRIVYWQKDISVIMLDDDIYKILLMIFITYHFTKMMMIVWACETAKNQALQIGTTVHDAFNSTGDNEIKSELQLFSLQVLHRKNIFSAMGLTVDAKLLTAMVGNISTYLLILIQFLNMSHFCAKEIATNVTEIIQ